MFWIALAAQMSMPPPMEILRVFSSQDVPEYVQRDGINRFIPTRTTVRPDGTIQDCGWERSSGDPKMDAYTCAIILKRAKLAPSKWIDGSPAYAVFRTLVTWAIGATPSEKDYRKAYPPDIEIFLNRLPTGVRSPTNVRLIVAVDENGRVVGCEAAPPMTAFHQEKSLPELVPAACEQMTTKYAAAPAKDASGRPVRSVQTAVAAFSRGP